MDWIKYSERCITTILLQAWVFGQGDKHREQWSHLGRKSRKWTNEEEYVFGIGVHLWNTRRVIWWVILEGTFVLCTMILYKDTITVLPKKILSYQSQKRNTEDTMTHGLLQNSIGRTQGVVAKMGPWRWNNKRCYDIIGEAHSSRRQGSGV